MKTLILASLLALTAVSGFVVPAQAIVYATPAHAFVGGIDNNPCHPRYLQGSVHNRPTPFH